MEYEKIYELRKEMIILGYKDLEVDAFIHDVIGNKSIDKLDEQEFKELFEYLDSYISFARKSKQLVSP